MRLSFSSFSFVSLIDVNNHAIVVAVLEFEFLSFLLSLILCLPSDYAGLLLRMTIY